MRKTLWWLLAAGLLLVGLPVLGGCGLTRWAIHKWGEPQYMSYHIDARNLALFTYPRQRFEYTAPGIDAALNLAGGRAANAGRPLVIFLHGRGKHPEKAFGDHPEVGYDILGQMTATFEVEVLMVHWPSWLDVAGYPSLNARETGPHLALLFERLRRYREAAAGGGALPVTLFVHSMGNQVLASFMETYAGRSGAAVPLLDTLILNAPDMDLEGHRLWVERLDFAGRRYVLVNSHRDRMLALSTYLLGKPRLGRQLVHGDDRPEPLAGNAAYVDLAALGVNHDYFYGEDLPAGLVTFYHRAFRPAAADPLTTAGMVPGGRGGLYLLRKP